MLRNKDWKVDIPPLIFFAAVVVSKTHLLVDYLGSNEQLWTLLSDGGGEAAVDPRVSYYLTSQFSFISYYVVSIAFDALVFFSFIVRGAAKDKPKGFSENIYPLITVFVPVLGFTLIFVPEIRQYLPPYPPVILEALAAITPMFPFYMTVGALMIGLFGAAFSIWAISYLRASFGLRTAVRELVTTGPYRRIRHPLYFGEIIHMLGIALLAGTPVALYLLVVAVALQAVRAKIEERKFIATIPAYAGFRDRTGFLWPKLTGARR
jgi:protein-S-isoprenylcysteine O-methyltransferase Ste14